MAKRVGLNSTNKTNALICLTTDIATTENIEENALLSNLICKENGQKKTAAPMAVGNGGNNKIEKASSKDCSYQSPANDAIETAANWYKDNRAEHQRTVIVSLRKRFDLTPLQAIQAIKRSYEIEQGGLR